MLLALFRGLGYSGIMKAQLNLQWRKKDEPEKIQEPEYVIRKALDAAGYYVGHITVQGVWDEDKPIQPGGKWDASRVPHEEIAR